MNCYLDSSVILQYLLKGDDAIQKVLEYEKVGASELLVIECKRVIQRNRIGNRISDAQYVEINNALDTFCRGLHVLSISDRVKERAAEAFPTVIGTLDAIHLSTAILWKRQEGIDVHMFTFDRQLSLASEAVGIPVLK